MSRQGSIFALTNATCSKHRNEKQYKPLLEPKQNKKINDKETHAILFKLKEWYPVVRLEIKS